MFRINTSKTCEFPFDFEVDSRNPKAPSEFLDPTPVVCSDCRECGSRFLDLRNVGSGTRKVPVDFGLLDRDNNY